MICGNNAKTLKIGERLSLAYLIFEGYLEYILAFVGDVIDCM